MKLTLFWIHRVAVLICVLQLPLSVSAANLPTYRVNAGEAQVGLSGIQFTFTGANLSIAGSEDFPPGPCGGLLGFPCGQAGDSIDINTLLVGSMFGFGTALATSFPFLEFVGDVDLVGSPLVIPNTKNPVVRGAFTFNNAPYLTACVPPFQCFEGGGTDAVFNIQFVPKGVVTIKLVGPFDDGFYYLTSAVYSPVPEPDSMALFGFGVLWIAGIVRHKLQR